MDYEKEYNNMVKRARELHEAGNALTKKQMEIVCPELAESEDERVRKWLIDLIAHLSIMWGQEGFTREQVLAWLEKQKEKKPISQEDFDAAKHEALWGEQKPADKQDYSGLTDLERAIHRGFLAAGVENVPVTIIKETEQDCLAQMKPVEWSEEDEKMRQHIISDLREFRDCETDEELISDYEDEIFWLKSLRPQPHWKPSEEQIYSLGIVVKGYDECTVGSVGYNLKELYEQLKKLYKL